MKASIYFIFVLIIELLLLFVIFLFLLFGLLGIFLPVLPGLLLIGIGAGLYSLLVNRGYGTVTPRVHRHMLNFRDRIHQLKITKKIMGLVKEIKKRKQKKIKDQILKHGLILLGFNLALILAFFFSFTFLSILGTLLKLQWLLIAFIPLLVIFLFAGFSAVIWYRFGQILGDHFKKKRLINSALVVLISILPLLLILLLFLAVISLSGGFTNEILALTFLGFLLMSILSVLFELLVVNLGVMTKTK